MLGTKKLPKKSTRGKEADGVVIRAQPNGLSAKLRHEALLSTLDQHQNSASQKIQLHLISRRCEIFSSRGYKESNWQVLAYRKPDRNYSSALAYLYLR
jgi:hypothetical protein